VVLALSFWKSREQEERYSQETFPAVQEVLRASLEADPVVRTFNVASSSTHNIAAAGRPNAAPGSSLGEPATKRIRLGPGG